jgi:peroxiredoxin
VSGLVFSPPSRSFSWRKSVHREEFDVFASKQIDGQTLNGSMTVFLGSVVIADVPLTISVDSNATSSAESISPDRSRSARRVRQVFASYSHKDEQVVSELAQVAPIFGSRFLLDRTHLEPGEDRVEGLQRLIRDADVFQLFWSTNSMRSPEIADEIRYALGLSRPGFILPTYWEEPVPRSPEEGLPPPEIDRLQFYRIYPSSNSWSGLEPKVVITGPPGAEIYLDDERYASIGTSGRVILKSIATGKHVLRITRPGTRDDERVLEVDPQLGEQLIEANLRTDSVAETAAVPASTFEDRASAPRHEETITAALPLPSQARPSPSRSTEINFETPLFKICVRCGMRYTTDEQFCNGCGSRLEHVHDQGAPSQLQAPAPSPPMMSSPALNHQGPVVAKRKRGYLVPLFAGAAMVLFLFVAAPIWFLTNQKSATSHPTVTGTGRPADSPDQELSSDLSFIDLDGRRFSLKDLGGRVVLLTVWSTGNAPSRDQVPVLNDMQESFGRAGLTVIGIAKDDTAERVRQFQRGVSQNYRVGFVSSGSLSSTQLPVTYVVDRKGKVRKKLVGVQSESTLTAAIQPLLNEAQ